MDGVMTPGTAAAALIEHFVFEQARDARARRAAFRVRYHVYCQEHGYEQEADCPGGFESDAFDAAASHCVVRHRLSGTPVACVRMVRPGAPGGALAAMPFERTYAAHLTHPELRPDRLPREQVCEISRIAVHAAFRRRSGEVLAHPGLPADFAPSPAEASAYPLLPISLFLAATALVGEAGRPHVFAMMQPRLARLLKRSGLDFTQIGGTVDFRGERAGFYIDQRIAERSLRGELPALYRHIQASLGAPESQPKADESAPGSHAA
ncbi:N-acyl amino acid synthase of PEP-CTERM/exosortase system [Natronocella acetinitrilica]|uniref:N-acyl amino acid synthase of PEP-CTERM/exosortase system n=1 Tax=Natronocella acetinitrilica TaxID=414046 RepID=A0AAE3G3M3_9GAMM|nr:PEP-CTERM/exosortase system-associated acyltransferase [Natronocella acetinitrilica]MCP1674459.1 N-acyl amino acid synthase of PEP-CTERM/exosortase system [Natronocella acetinitrilica]